MPTTVAIHQLEDLAHGESKNEILLAASLNVELHITVKSDCTIITMPFGNKFDIVGGQIIIHEL